jgi:methyl halide transferase
MITIKNNPHPTTFNLLVPATPDWESAYVLGETPWDKGFASPPLSWFLQLGQWLPAGRVLVPGCGRGHDVRLLAGLEGI